MTVCSTSANEDVPVIRTYKYGAKNKGQQRPYNKWPCKAQKLATRRVRALLL